MAANIKDTAASVHQRLLKRARESSRPFNEFLQHFAIERFIYRLSKSPNASERLPSARQKVSLARREIYLYPVGCPCGHPAAKEILILRPYRAAHSNCESQKRPILLIPAL